MNNKSNLLR